MTLLRSLLGASVSTDLASLPVGGTPSDAFVVPALNTAGAAVQMSLSSLLSWVQGHYPDLSTTTARVILAANAPLDASVHNRRLIVATPGSGTTVTLSPPAVFANLGTNFYCDLINYGPGALAFGAGIKTSYSTLAVGQSARIVAFYLADGVTGVIEALFSAPLNTTPAIALTGPSAVPAVPSGSSSVGVPIAVAMMNFSGTPTLQYSLDGAAYAALPSGATTGSTSVSGLAFALGGGSHTLLLKDTGTGTVSNTLTLTVESETLAGVPTTGWTVGAAKALTGATTVLAGLTTAYAVLWNGSAEVGSRQAFTSSATLAALSFTPAAANTTTTIRAFDAATGGNLLAESPAITVAAAAAQPVFGPNGTYLSGASDTNSVVVGAYRFHGWPQGNAAGTADPNPSYASVPGGSGQYGSHPDLRWWIERVTPVGSAGYSGTGLDPTDGATPGFSGTVTCGWVTAVGATPASTFPVNVGGNGSVPTGRFWESGGYVPTTPGKYWLSITTSDGVTGDLGPIQVTA